jgi:hypothetical protein
MQSLLSTYPNLEIRSANVQDIVLNWVAVSEGESAHQRVVGLRVSELR